MSRLITRYVFDDDFTPERTWELLAWCIAHDADEFSVTLMSIAGEPAPACEAFEAALTDAARGVQPRPVRAGLTAEIENIPVWTLTPQSAAVLRSVFADTLLHYELDTTAGWFEDPIFLRRGEVMLAVVSHEQEGVLCLTAPEHNEVESAGYLTRPSGTWISY